MKPTVPTAGALGAAQGANRLAAAAAGVNLVVDLAGIAGQYINRQRAAEATAAERKNLQSSLDAAGEEAITQALHALTGLSDDARQRIMDATVDQVELRDSLHQLVSELRSLISSGEALLGS